MSPTWDEYLDQVDEHLAALDRATELGIPGPGSFPTRPAGAIPDRLRGEARRLSEVCDRVAASVARRMTVIAVRPPPRHQGVHHEHPAARYVETDI